MSDDSWHYAQAGQQFGPIPRSEILARISRGEIQPTDLVWTEGMSEWQPARTVRALFPAAAPPPLPQMDASVPYAARATIASMYPPPRDLGQDATMRMLLPVGRSGLAIVAGYLGLFSFLVIPGPIALIISILAIRDIRAHPEKHGMGRAIFGLVIGILATIVLAFAMVALLSRH